MEQTDNNDILKHVNKIEDTVKRLEKEKHKIQNECKHQGKTYIDFDVEKSIKKYCSLCKSEMGYATKEESTNFLRPKGQKNT